MRDTFDLVPRGGICVTPGGTLETDNGVAGGKIAAIGDLGGAATAEVFDVGGLHVLPGVIDPHVHYREPGNEHKDDMDTGSAGTVPGGVTAVCEMPNTNPATTGAVELAEKCRRAKGRVRCDIGQIIEERFGLRIGLVTQTVWAETLDAKSAALLGSTMGGAALVVERKYSESQDRPAHLIARSICAEGGLTLVSKFVAAPFGNP